MENNDLSNMSDGELLSLVFGPRRFIPVELQHEASLEWDNRIKKRRLKQEGKENEQN